MHVLTPHGLYAVTAVITGRLHMKKQTSYIDDKQEGYIIVPLRIDWRKLQ